MAEDLQTFLDKLNRYLYHVDIIDNDLGIPTPTDLHTILYYMAKPEPPDPTTTEEPSTTSLTTFQTMQDDDEVNKFKMYYTFIDIDNIKSHMNMSIDMSQLCNKILINFSNKDPHQIYMYPITEVKSFIVPSAKDYPSIGEYNFVRYHIDYADNVWDSNNMTLNINLGPQNLYYQDPNNATEEALSWLKDNNLDSFYINEEIKSSISYRIHVFASCKDFLRNIDYNLDTDRL